MKPTLKQGNYILVSKFPYNLRTPEFYPLTDITFPFLSINSFGEVNHGDIIIFDLPVFSFDLHPSQKEDYIKRCVGLPGDMIFFYKDQYYLKRRNNTVNKNKVSEYLIDSMMIPSNSMWINLEDSSQDIWEAILRRDGNSVQFDSSGSVYINGAKRAAYQVTQNYYFVKGDNYWLSSDSRNWGLVPKRNLIGRAELVVWPWPPRWL